MMETGSDAPTVAQLSLWYDELKMVHKRLRDAHEVVQAEVKRYKTSTSRVVDEYVCPITHQLPVDPVMAEDGTVYDRHAIAEWIDKNKITDPTGSTFVKSPMSNANMGTKLTEMRLVRNTIQELIDSHLVDDEMAAAVLKQRAVKEAAVAGDPEAMYSMGVETFDRAMDLLEGEDQHEAYRSNDWFRRGAAVHDMKCMAMEGSHLYRGFEPWRPNMPERKDRVKRLHGLVYIARAAEQVDLAAYCMAVAYINEHLSFDTYDDGVNNTSDHPSNVAQAKYWLDRALGVEIKHKIMSEHDRFEAERELEQVERLQKKFEEQKQYVGEYRGEGVGKGKRVYPNGSVYEGDFTDGVRHGQGKMVYLGGNVYDGEWKCGATHGHGKIVYADGGYYEGSFENDVPHGDGHGKLHYASSGYYEGELNRGVQHGQGKMVYADGNVYEGAWDNGRAHGHGKIVYAHGGHYEGSFENDVPRGEGKMVYENGNVYEGAWQRGMANGHGQLRYANGTFYEGNFENNEPQGQGKQVYKDGVVYEYEGEMNKGKKHGKGKVKCGDAYVLECEWKDDKIYGEGKKTLANGEVDISWFDEVPMDQGVKWSQDRKRAWELSGGLHHRPPKRISLKLAAEIAAFIGLPVPT